MVLGALVIVNHVVMQASQGDSWAKLGAHVAGAHQIPPYHSGRPQGRCQGCPSGQIPAGSCHHPEVCAQASCQEEGRHSPGICHMSLMGISPVLGGLVACSVCLLHKVPSSTGACKTHCHKGKASKAGVVLVVIISMMFAL